MAVYLQYITDYTYGTGKKKCNNIPTPILSFSLPHCFPWWKPRALVCGRADMPQNYSKANTFLLPSTLPSTVEIQGALCAEVMACHNISTPLRCVPFRSVQHLDLFRACARYRICTARFLVISAWLRSLPLCSVPFRCVPLCSVPFPLCSVPFRSVPFHSALFRKRT